MKIYLYLKHFPADGAGLEGGTVKAAHGLAAGLVTCGAEVVVLCEGPRPDSVCQSPAGYQISSWKSETANPSFRCSSGLQRYLAEIPRSERCLFVLNGIFHPSVYAVSRILRKHSLPYVIAPHDPYHSTIFQKNAHFKWAYWYLAERRMLKQACAIQVLDQRHGDLLHRLHVRTPVFAVPNGFSPEDLVPESTLEWNHNSIPQFLFLGRIDSYNKGLDILLDALAQLTEIPEWRVTFQGPDWGDRAGLKEQAQQLKLNGRVTFLDPDFSTPPAALIARYDIFCVTSRFEGFSLSALEAMLAGRTILVSEIAGIAPHVEAGRCGVVVAPEPAAIKAGLLELLKRREQWKEMGLSGRQYALDHLHWTPIAAQALKEYERLIR